MSQKFSVLAYFLGAFRLIKNRHTFHALPCIIASLIKLLDFWGGFHEKPPEIDSK